MITLPRKIALYIPSQHRDTAEALALAFTEHCNGVTVQSGHGGWRDQHGEPVAEEVEIISTWYGDEVSVQVQAAAALAVVSLLDQGEEAVLVEETAGGNTVAILLGASEYDELKEMAGLE